MKYFMYCLKNEFTSLYEGIMLYRNDRVANRALEATFEKNKDLNPEDFTLYRVGEFDNESGTASVYAPAEVPFITRDIPEEDKMSDKRDDNSVL